MKLFEIHITFNVPEEEKKKELEEFTERMNWKWSYIRNDPVLGKRNFCYATKYASTLEQAKEFIRLFSSECVFVPVRQKIEHIVYDTKLGESFLGLS